MKKRNFFSILFAAAMLFAVGAQAQVDVLTGTVPVSTIFADTTLTDRDGESVDLFGYYGVLVVAEVGPSAATLATDLKLELELEESSNGSTWTDVSDTHLSGYVAGVNDGCFGVIDGAADDSTTYYARYIGSKRYIRVVVNCVGVIDGSTPVSATVIRSHPRWQ